MLGEPKVVDRGAQPYVSIKALVTMAELGSVLPPLHPELKRWLSQRGSAPAGAPFFKYNVIDMERHLEVEVGLPVADAIAGDDRVIAGVLLPGRYATMLYTGHPEGLLGATRALLEWAEPEGLKWDVTTSPEGDRWGSRLEIYASDDPD